MNKRKEILFVDDTEGICRIFRILVESRCQVNITTCNSGEEALKLLEHNIYDLLITDIVMPGMDGIQLTNIVLKAYDIPIVLTTGHSKDILPSGYDKTEAVCCISKPYTVTEISTKVREAFIKKKRKDKMKQEESRVEDNNQKPTYGYI